MTEITEPTLKLCWNPYAIRGCIQALRAAHMDIMADDVEAQLPKRVDEPTGWGSVVRARRVGYGSEDTTSLRWQRQNTHDSNSSWVSEPAGDLGVLYSSHWSYLADPEVLRVGLGEPVNVHEFMTSAGFDPTPAQASAFDDGFHEGRQEMNAAIHYGLQLLLAEAITGERKNAYEKAIQAVEELAP